MSAYLYKDKNTELRRLLPRLFGNRRESLPDAVLFSRVLEAPLLVEVAGLHAAARAVTDRRSR